MIELMLQMGMGTEARGRKRRRSEPTVRNLRGAELNPEVCWSLTLWAVWQEGLFCTGAVLCVGLQRSPQGLARLQPSAQWRFYLPFKAHLFLKGGVWGCVQWSISQSISGSLSSSRIRWGRDKVTALSLGLAWLLYSGLAM